MSERAVIYIRQSISHDESVSPALQESACRDYAQRCGYQVVDVVEDLGITGRTWKRAGVVKVFDMVEQGQADVILVWKWSRVSRSRRDWAVAADRADVAGGRIESSTETVDVSTATGRLARGVLVEFAAFESDRIGEVWKEVHASRLADGRAPTGKPKFGYAWDAVAKLHRPDPVTGPVLASLYGRYVAGESVYALVRWLASSGHRTTAGGQWSDRSLRRVMDAGFAAGFVPWHGMLHPGAHDALIDADLWQAYQDARARRRVMPARVVRSQYLLSGLVRCGRCGGSMTAGQFGHARAPKYRCKTGKEQGPQACEGGYVMTSLVEDTVVDWLRGLAAEVDAAALTAAANLPDSRPAPEVERTRLQQQIARLDGSLHRLTIQLAEGVVPEAAYVLARDDLKGRRGRLLRRLEALWEGEPRATAPRPRRERLLDSWDLLPVQHRRELLVRLLARVEVVTGRPRAHIAVVPAWAG